MSKPQQPELHRSGTGATDPASVKADAELNDKPGAAGPIPAGPCFTPD